MHDRVVWPLAGTVSEVTTRWATPATTRLVCVCVCFVLAGALCADRSSWNSGGRSGPSLLLRAGLRSARARSTGGPPRSCLGVSCDGPLPRPRGDLPSPAVLGTAQQWRKSAVPGRVDTSETHVAAERIFRVVRSSIAKPIPLLQCRLPPLPQGEVLHRRRHVTGLCHKRADGLVSLGGLHQPRGFLYCLSHAAGADTPAAAG